MDEGRATKRKKAVFVVGMHRSGTSALTRTLSLLGCQLPKTLSPASPGDNDLGFWESSLVVGLNEAILDSAGSVWNDWMPFSAGWYDSAVRDEFHDRALQVLEGEFGGGRLFVLKDPRLCRLLKFWVEAARDFGAEPVIVSPIRNPLEIAASLKKRNDIDPSLSHLTWLRHTLEAEAASRELLRSYVRYDDLLAAWQGVADKISRDLNLAWPRQSIDTAFSIEAFLSPDLHRHHANDKGVIANPNLSRWIGDTFEILNRWSQGESKQEDFRRLDQIKAAFDEAIFAFGRPVSLWQRATTRANELERGIVDVNKKLTANEASLVQRTKDTEELRGKLARAEESLQQRASEAETIRRQLADAQARETAAKAKADELSKAVEEFRNLRAHAESALIQRQHEAEQMGAQLQSVRNTLNTTLEERTQKIAALEADTGRLEHELRDARSHRVAAETRADEAGEAGKELRGKLARAEELLQQRASEAETIRRQLAEAEAREAAAKAEADELSKTVEELRSQRAHAESALIQRQHEAEQTAAELQSVRNTLNASLEERTQKIVALEADNGRLEHELRDARRHRVAAETRADEASESGEELRGKLIRTESALIQRQHEAEQIAAELQSVRSTLNASLEERDLKIAALEAKNSQFEQKLKERFSESAILSRQLLDSAGQLDTAKREISVLRSRSHDDAKRAAELEATLQNTSQNIATLTQRKTAEIEKLKAQMADVTRAAQTEKDKLERQIKERHLEIAVLSRQMLASGQQVADAKQRFFLHLQKTLEHVLSTHDLPRVPLISRTAVWNWLMLRRRTAALRRSGLLDGAWYLARNKDVADAGVDPVEHYVKYGLKEGRAPNQAIDEQISRDGGK